eukprot:8658784-Pyramimonas_sp.AAC.1
MHTARSSFVRNGERGWSEFALEEERALISLLCFQSIDLKHLKYPSRHQDGPFYGLPHNSVMGSPRSTIGNWKRVLNVAQVLVLPLVWPDFGLLSGDAAVDLHSVGTIIMCICKGVRCLVPSEQDVSFWSKRVGLPLARVSRLGS